MFKKFWSGCFAAEDEFPSSTLIPPPPPPSLVQALSEVESTLELDKSLLLVEHPFLDQQEIGSLFEDDDDDGEEEEKMEPLTLAQELQRTSDLYREQDLKIYCLFSALEEEWNSTAETSTPVSGIARSLRAAGKVHPTAHVAAASSKSAMDLKRKPIFKVNTIEAHLCSLRSSSMKEAIHRDESNVHWISPLSPEVFGTSPLWYLDVT